MRIATLVLAVSLTASCASAQIGNIVITSAASFQQGKPTAGSIASIFCTGLRGINGIVGAGGFPLPLELAGVRVTIGGIGAPLFAVADLGIGFQQINLQVPWEAGYATDIVVEQSGQQGMVVAPSLSSSGQFFRMPDGSGAFQHAADYALVSGANPARAGEAVIGYLTGLGSTMPQVGTGQPAPADPPAVVNQVVSDLEGRPPRFQISVSDGANQKVVDPLFVGLAPGFAGLYQLNFVVPEGLGAGTRAVTLIENSCTWSIFGTCVVVSFLIASLPVPMAVQ